MKQSNFTKFAYQTLQTSKSFAGLAHKGISAKLMEILAPAAVPDLEPVSKELLIKLRRSVSALEKLEKEGIHLVVEGAADPEPEAGEVLILDFIGPDHPGILHEISHCLAEYRVSVETIRTELEPAPMGGGQLFHATGRVRMPADLAEDDLRNALESLAGDLMVDITLVEESE